ncbi:MAG: homoserine O-acetyltransferase [Calditrichia bacterium]
MEYINDQQGYRWIAAEIEFPFLMLENGSELKPVKVAYEMWEPLRPGKTDTILVCHALTGNAHAGDSGRPEAPPGWWNGLVAPSAALDPSRYRIICSNVLGSCYGTTGPASINPKTGRPFGAQFPEVTVRDMVRLQKMLLDRLGINRLKTVIGGSLGGMQALEWAIMFPDYVESIIPIASLGRHSAWGIAWNEVARMAIMNDPAYAEDNGTSAPRRGLALARMAAMISYRTPQSYHQKFGQDILDDPARNRTADLFPESSPRYEVENYLRYQGQKLVDRFNAHTYITLSRAIDSHDIFLGRGDVREVLGKLKIPALCIGISTDLLYPKEELEWLAKEIPLGEYREIDSIHGHDAFLIEYDQLNEMVAGLLRTLEKQKRLF